MNKYQNSLDNFVKALTLFTNFKSMHEWKSDLQELVDKATPKKPINQSTPVVRQGYCPNCKGELRKLGSRNEVVLEGQLYCCSCGQALDWGTGNNV